MGNVTEVGKQEKKFINEFVMKFAKMEEDIRKEYSNIFDDPYCSALMSMSLVNIVCNFIYHNSTPDGGFLKNFDKFMSDMIEWIQLIQEKDKKH